MDVETVIKVFEDIIKEETYPDRPRRFMMPLELAEQVLAVLKGKEAHYPVCEKCGKEIDHINTSIFNHDGSDSDYSVPITYDKESRCVTFSTSQNWAGYSLTDEEQKENIRCPYCGKFPFDSSIENEFYEPVEVMMWTSEGR